AFQPCPFLPPPPRTARPYLIVRIHPEAKPGSAGRSPSRPRARRDKRSEFVRAEVFRQRSAAKKQPPPASRYAALRFRPFPVKPLPTNAETAAGLSRAAHPHRFSDQPADHLARTRSAAAAGMAGGDGGDHVAGNETAPIGGGEIFSKRL